MFALIQRPGASRIRFLRWKRWNIGKVFGQRAIARWIMVLYLLVVWFNHSLQRVRELAFDIHATILFGYHLFNTALWRDLRVSVYFKFLMFDIQIPSRTRRRVSQLPVATALRPDTRTKPKNCPEEARGKDKTIWRSVHPKESALSTGLFRRWVVSTCVFSSGRTILDCSVEREEPLRMKTRKNCGHFPSNMTSGRIENGPSRRKNTGW